MTTCFGTVRPGIPVGPLSINYVIKVEHSWCGCLFFFCYWINFFIVLNIEYNIIIVNILLYNWI